MEYTLYLLSGHYLEPAVALKSSLTPLPPPSAIIKGFFQDLLHYPPSEGECQNAAKSTLLSTEEVKVWFEHLHTIGENRKRGAARAAATRKRKRQEKQQQEERAFCAACMTLYQNFTDSVENWIACETCSSLSVWALIQQCPW